LQRKVGIWSQGKIVPLLRNVPHFFSRTEIPHRALTSPRKFPERDATSPSTLSCSRLSVAVRFSPTIRPAGTTSRRFLLHLSYQDLLTIGRSYSLESTSLALWASLDGKNSRSNARPEHFFFRHQNPFFFLITGAPFLFLKIKVMSSADTLFFPFSLGSAELRLLSAERPGDRDYRFYSMAHAAFSRTFFAFPRQAFSRDLEFC